MNAIFNILSAILEPMGILNALSGIVPGVWLAFLSEWGTIGYGIMLAFLSTFVLGFALLPAAPLTIFTFRFLEKGNKIVMYFFALLGNLYIIAVIAFWCCTFLYMFLTRANSDSIIPTLLWSYGVSTSPLSWMAEKEQRSNGLASLISTFFAQVGYIVMILMVLFLPVTILDVLMVFSVIMLMGLAIQLKLFLAVKIPVKNELY